MTVNGSASTALIDAPDPPRSPKRSGQFKPGTKAVTDGDSP